MAGKTGTAQKAGRGGYSPTRFVGSFVGYVPADRPRLVILVVDRRAARRALRRHRGRAGVPRDRRGDAALPRRAAVHSVAYDRRRASRCWPRFRNRRSRRPAPASAVPDLRGLDARAAIARAVASGLTVRAIGSGVVTSQDPEPGGALPQRSIDLTLHARGGCADEARRAPPRRARARAVRRRRGRRDHARHAPTRVS